MKGIEHIRFGLTFIQSTDVMKSEVKCPSHEWVIANAYKHTTTSSWVGMAGKII